MAKCDALADSPARYPFDPHLSARGVRRRPHGRYLIFYRIKADVVEILHVIHGARDYEALLDD